MTPATHSILLSSLNREDLDDRLLESGLARDLEAEIDSRYVLLGDEISVVDGVNTLNALSENARVAPHDLGFVLWVWVSNDDILGPPSSDRESDTFLSSDYIAHASAVTARNPRVITAGRNGGVFNQRLTTVYPYSSLRLCERLRK